MGRTVLATSIGLLVAVLSAPCDGNRSRRVFPHYLPWYTGSGDGWTYTDTSTGQQVQQCVSSPLIGEYSQLNSSVLEYHLLTSLVSGFDGFIVNWDPRSDQQTSIISNLFSKAETLPQVFDLDGTGSSTVSPRLIISYDYQGSNHSLANIASHFESIRNSWVVSPVYFHDDAAQSSAPVIVLWNSEATAVYSQAARSVFNNNVTLLTINADFSNFNLSTGAFEWVMPQDEATYNPSLWAESYLNDFDWRMAHQKDYGGVPASDVQTLMMGAVYPGFNDSKVPVSWNGGNTRLVLTVDLLCCNSCTRD